MGELQSSIQFLSGVGPKRAALLQQELGISTLEDLIHLYPFRHIDRSSILPIAGVDSSAAAIQVRGRVQRLTLYGPGSTVLAQTAIGPDGAVHTEIANVRTVSSGREVPTGDARQIRFNIASRLSVMVSDGTGSMEMVFFKGIKWNFQRLFPGSEFIFFGKPQEYGGRWSIVHPEVDAPQPGNMAQGVLTGVYPSTEKLKTGGITGKVMCKLESAALSLCLPEVKETLPDYLIAELGLCPLQYALKNIHFPTDRYALEKAERRLKFEELFLLQLSLLKQKYIRSRNSTGLEMPKVGPDFHACYDSLPYSLTGAQQRVIKEIRADIMSGRQMNRLLQGDVGSGKTMVAVLSCLMAIGNGYQTCIMAPTEVLAQQHYANIQKYLAPTGVRCALLTGSVSQKERRPIMQGLADGTIGLVVGTHALLEDPVQWKALGLAVIDEQHRFGVEQRARLWSKGPEAPGGTGARLAPHILVMTATPIPRTLAMTLYGDLDVSVIDEMPPGRKPVKTMCVGESGLAKVFHFMRKEIAAGRQVFVVFPMIFESEKTDMQNLERGYEEIVNAFPLKDGYKVAIVHGQQTPEQKAFNMDAFAAGRAQILVATTVIEVGVDVPNASVMVIRSAQRFGLSQLHQLRGRVGRGADMSYCILMKDVKTSREAQQRLDLMCSTQNGFDIAEEDMRLRGPGDLEGTQQSGLPIALNIASLAKDGRLLEEARNCAARVLDADPALEAPENARLRAALRGSRYEIRDFSKIS